MKIMLSVNTTWNIVNFRSGLIRELVRAGHEVVAVSPTDAYCERLAELGCRHIAMSMDNKGVNPVQDLALFARYLNVIRVEKPAVFLGWTIKPNIYGSMAAAVLNIPVINNVSGLGTAFLHEGWLTTVVKTLYRVGLARSKTVFFQNRDDERLFLDNKMISPRQSALLAGSGIDLGQFSAMPRREWANGEGPAFLLIARMLWDKGVGEFVEAARRVKETYPAAQFNLLGFVDVVNRTAVPRETIARWELEGLVSYLGHTDDVRPYIESSDCVVLPSYREGAPRSLIEAAAMSRPIIATDATGCREVVVDGLNGWLCRVRDHEDLAAKMVQFIETPGDARFEMGLSSRELAVRKFDETGIIAAYTGAIARARSA